MLVNVVVYTCCGLTELFNWFISLSLYIVFSSPMEATFQACHFQVRSISMSLSLVSQVCSVISNNNPPSTPGKNCLKGISDRLERKKISSSCNVLIVSSRYWQRSELLEVWKYTENNPGRDIWEKGEMPGVGKTGNISNSRNDYMIIKGYHYIICKII